MAKIVFNPGLSWENLPPARRARLIDQDQARQRLQAIRSEWQEAAGDLSRVTVDLAALFDDLGEITG